MLLIKPKEAGLLAGGRKLTLMLGLGASDGVQLVVRQVERPAASDGLGQLFLVNGRLLTSFGAPVDDLLSE